MQRTENREIPTKQQYWSNLHFLINPTTLASKKCYRYTPLRVRLDPPVIRVHTVGWWLCSLPNYSRICRDDFRYFFFFFFSMSPSVCSNSSLICSQPQPSVFIPSKQMKSHISMWARLCSKLAFQFISWKKSWQKAKTSLNIVMEIAAYIKHIFA